MSTQTTTRPILRTPKAAAIAGLVFSILLITIFSLLRLAIPAEPHDSGAWIGTDARSIDIALRLVPFAGIAFLWFIGVRPPREPRGPPFRRDRRWPARDLRQSVSIDQRLRRVPPRTGDHLQPGQRLHGQAGRRVHVHDIDRRHLHEHRATLAGLARLCAVAAAPFASTCISWSFLVFPIWVMLISASMLRDDFRRLPNEDRSLAAGRSRSRCPRRPVKAPTPDQAFARSISGSQYPPPVIRGALL